MSNKGHGDGKKICNHVENGLKQEWNHERKWLKLDVIIMSLNLILNSLWWVFFLGDRWVWCKS